MDYSGYTEQHDYCLQQPWQTNSDASATVGSWSSMNGGLRPPEPQAQGSSDTKKLTIAKKRRHCIDDVGYCYKRCGAIVDPGAVDSNLSNCVEFPRRSRRLTSHAAVIFFDAITQKSTYLSAVLSTFTTTKYRL